MHVFDGKKLNFHFLNSLFSGIAARLCQRCGQMGIMLGSLQQEISCPVKNSLNPRRDHTRSVCERSNVHGAVHKQEFCRWRFSMCHKKSETRENIPPLWERHKFLAKSCWVVKSTFFVLFGKLFLHYSQNISFCLRGLVFEWYPWEREIMDLFSSQI